LTILGKKRTEPRKGLKRTSLKPQSEKAKSEMVIWRKVKQEREKLLRDKFGYLPCEWCKKAILNGYHGHHNDHNRRNNTLGNARLLEFSCHMFVEDNNIKDVPSLL
jgi:hypothetical protein